MRRIKQLIIFIIFLAALLVGGCSTTVSTVVEEGAPQVKTAAGASYEKMVFAIFMISRNMDWLIFCVGSWGLYLMKSRPLLLFRYYPMCRILSHLIINVSIIPIPLKYRLPG